MIRQFASRQFVAFLVTGGIAALVNFGSRIVLNHWMPFPVAVVVAYLLGMVTAFVLARAFVFAGSTQSVQRSAGLSCETERFSSVRTKACERPSAGR